MEHARIARHRCPLRRRMTEGRAAVHGAVRVRALAACIAAFTPLACSSALDVSDTPVANVTVAPSSLNLGLGLVAPLQATAEDAAGNVLHNRQIFWSSSDTTVATVSDAGVVTALALGTAVIAASAEGESATATITVTPPPVARVDVLPSDVQTTVGATVQLQALTYDALGHVLTGRTIAWSTSDQHIATVDDDGRVKARETGQVTISATSEGQTGTATVTILVPVDHIDIRPPFAIVKPGRTTQLTALVYDDDGHQLTDREVTWASSDPSIATVSATGLVTGIRTGAVQISATAEGKNAATRILVSSLLGNVRAVQP